MPGLAALLLLALASCGAFHRNPTVQTAKEVVKALPEAVDALKDSARATQELADAIKKDVVPPVARAAETTSKVLDWGFYALATGAAGGLFSFVKTGWRWVRKKKKPKPPG